MAGNVATEEPIYATTWIVGDFDNETGLESLKDALKGLVCASLMSYRQWG